MTAVTVQNVDWSILESVRAALAGATIGGEAVFRAVTVTSCDQQALQCQLRTSPVAIVRYATTREDDSPEDVRGGLVELELIVAADVGAAGADEAAALQEVLRLKNAAMNAVEAAPPAAGAAWGDADHYHRRIEWKCPRADCSTHQPWAIGRLGVQIGFVLTGPTGH